MQNPIHISTELGMPVNAATEVFAWLGRRGSGKTYGASKMAEEMLGVGIQVVVLDFVGVWYGLRLLGDGKTKGLDIPVFGGLHGDIPLESTGGVLIANVITDHGISAVIDVSQMISADQLRFSRDFATQFFERKKSKPSAVHLMVEECQEVIPQNPQKDETKVLHAFQRLVKLGRNFGIGVSLISQRPQEVAKKVINMAEVLFAFQMTGPQEREAIRKWVAEKGADLDIVEALPRMQVGQCHVWSPQWLGISKTISISRKRTFDASSTPSVGVGKSTVTLLPPAALDKIRVDMAATIERAKADDPRELRKEIATLKTELASKPKAQAVDPQETQKAIDKAVEKYRSGIRSTIRKALESLAPVVGRIEQVRELLDPLFLDFTPVNIQSFAGKPSQTFRAPSFEPRKLPTTAYSNGNTHLGNSGLRRIMVALAQAGRPLTDTQIGVRAQLSSSSGTFGTYLGTGRTNGWITGERNNLQITEEGLAALGSYDLLPTGAELLNYWLSKLGNSGSSRMLSVLAAKYPNSLTAEEVGEGAGIAHTSGTFGTYLGTLRTLELISGSRDSLRASEEFFV